MRQLSKILNAVYIGIYNDRVTIHALGFGIGWTACNVDHNGLSYLLSNVLTTVIVLWGYNIMHRKTGAIK